MKKIKKFKPGKKQRLQRGQEEIGFVIVMAFVSIAVLVVAAVLLSTLRKFFR